MKQFANAAQFSKNDALLLQQSLCLIHDVVDCLGRRSEILVWSLSFDLAAYLLGLFSPISQENKAWSLSQSMEVVFWHCSRLEEKKARFGLLVIYSGKSYWLPLLNWHHSYENEVIKSFSWVLISCFRLQCRLSSLVYLQKYLLIYAHFIWEGRPWGRYILQTFCNFSAYILIHVRSASKIQPEEDTLN